MIQLTVRASAHLVADSWLEIDKDGARNVLASTSLREEGVEGIIAATNGFIGGHLAIRLDAVLEAVKLPASLLVVEFEVRQFLLIVAILKRFHLRFRPGHQLGQCEWIELLSFLRKIDFTRVKLVKLNYVCLQLNGS